nr:ATP-binding cassette domain-containing protein [Paenibacillus contaminans]
MGENAAASTDYDEAQVWRSLDVSGIGDKVRGLSLNLKQHIYNHVELEGLDISGGEEQKLAIVRAYYKDSPIMILNEPTAATKESTSRV